jgi:hypothetical protein
MQESARIEAVKNLKPAFGIPTAGKPTIREFERWLVRDAGLSRGDARLVITKGYRHALNQLDAVSGSQPLAAKIRSAARALQLSSNRKYK